MLSFVKIIIRANEKNYTCNVNWYLFLIHCGNIRPLWVFTIKTYETATQCYYRFYSTRAFKTRIKYIFLTWVHLLTNELFEIRGNDGRYSYIKYFTQFYIRLKSLRKKNCIVFIWSVLNLTHEVLLFLILPAFCLTCGNFNKVALTLLKTKTLFIWSYYNINVVWTNMKNKKFTLIISTIK